MDQQILSRGIARLQNPGGFSLLELTAVLLLLLLSATLAVPNFNSLYSSAERFSVRNTLAADILAARNRALAQGTRVIINIAADGDSYNVGFDHIPFSNPPAADVIDFVRLLPSNVSLGPAQTLVFDSRGYLINPQGELSTANIVLSHRQLAFTIAGVTPTGLVDFQ